MSNKFSITKRVDLSYIGDDWKDCYIDMAMPSYAEAKVDAKIEGTDEEKGEKAIEKLGTLFRKGFAINEEGKKIEITKEDLFNFPIEVLTKCIQAITGQIDPK